MKSQSNQDAPTARGQAFRLRRLREEYGESGLTRQELAALAGVPVSLLVEFEETSRIPAMIEVFARLAFALQVPPFELFESSAVRDAWTGIARRRQDIEGGSRRPIGFAVSES